MDKHRAIILDIQKRLQELMNHLDAMSEKDTAILAALHENLALHKEKELEAHPPFPPPCPRVQEKRQLRVLYQYNKKFRTQ